MNDIRKNDKVSMNRQRLDNSAIFAMRKNTVKWPTIRKAYLTDENVEVLRKLATGKGRSIIFLDGEYETKLNRYVRKDPIERAVFFEYMVRNKGTKGAIFMYCWIGNFHNGTIAHFSFQYPQVNCWLEAMENPTEFFDKVSFQLYREIAYILYGGEDKIVDKEVKKFIDEGNNAK
jgi:hypothetical protein